MEKAGKRSTAVVEATVTSRIPWSLSVVGIERGVHRPVTVEIDGMVDAGALSQSPACRSLEPLDALECVSARLPTKLEFVLHLTSH